MRGVCRVDPIKLRTSVYLVSFITLYPAISGKADTQMTSKKERKRKEGRGEEGERERKRTEGKNSGRREERGRRGITAG